MLYLSVQELFTDLQETYIKFPELKKISQFESARTGC